MQKMLSLFFVSATILGMNQEQQQPVRSSGVIAQLQMRDPDELVDSVDERIIGPMSQVEKDAVETCEAACKCGCALICTAAACCRGYDPCIGVVSGLCTGMVCGNLSAIFLIWNVRTEKEKLK